MRSIYLISFFLILFSKASYGQNYEIGETRAADSIEIKKNGTSVICKLPLPYEFSRLSTDRKFALLKLARDANADKNISGFFEIADAHEKCKNNAQVVLHLAPNLETVTDANKRAGIYSTGKNDVYPIGGNATQVFFSAAIRAIENSREIIFPFSILEKETAKNISKKIFLNPPIYNEFNNDTSQPSPIVISRNGRYISPGGVICDGRGNYSGSIFSVKEKKLIYKPDNWLSTKKGVDECREMFD